jgi:hypothetical protein
MGRKVMKATRDDMGNMTANNGDTALNMDPAYLKWYSELRLTQRCV